ncbi:hypothetical protein [Halorussus halophilus]|uniref:hypothetical protein n=1 Tax=Halorussus halophilus TaxID=2650975 RepID=UPI00130169FB|nr:hypothetical protein [Halorussus halophilus]
MDDPMDAVYRWLEDDTNQILTLFLLAATLGVGSLAYFFLSGDSSPSRLQFALLFASVLVIFYVSLRSSTF